VCHRRHAVRRVDKALVAEFIDEHLPRCNCAEPARRNRLGLRAALSHLLYRTCPPKLCSALRRPPSRNLCENPKTGLRRDRTAHSSLLYIGVKRGRWWVKPTGTCLLSFKRLWRLFEVVFSMIVDWHPGTPVRECRRVKMYEWTHKHRLQRYWSSRARGRAPHGCLGTHARVRSMTSSSIRSN
jgi:hypothetical protein